MAAHSFFPVFEPLFAQIRVNRYDDKFVMVSDLTQRDVLLTKFDSNKYRMYEVKGCFGLIMTSLTILVIRDSSFVGIQNGTVIIF